MAAWLKKNWGIAVLILLERGLDFSGYTSPSVAGLLWFLALTWGLYGNWELVLKHPVWSLSLVALVALLVGFYVGQTARDGKPQTDTGISLQRPTGDRYLATSAEALADGTHRRLFEFGVRSTPVAPGFSVGLSFHGQGHKYEDCWFSHPNGNLSSVRKPCGIGQVKRPTTDYAEFLRIGPNPITPSQSFYLEFRSNEAIVVIDCYFQSQVESEPTRCGSGLIDFENRTSKTAHRNPEPASSK